MNDVAPRRRIRLVAGAALVGLLAVLGGVAGVYVTEQGAGNGATGRCAAALPTAERLKPLTTGEVAALLPASAPEDVRDLAFFREDGAAGTVGDYAGKAVLLNLWATWCIPCREEMPALDRLQQARGGERFQVVTVNLDVGDPAKPAAFLKETGIKSLPDFRDPKMKIFNDLKARSLAFGMPTTLIIDADGCQVAALHGPAEWDSAEAGAVIDAVSSPAPEG
jgi:thiol-disulfide isomerase/thioredoxin